MLVKRKFIKKRLDYVTGIAFSVDLEISEYHKTCAVLKLRNCHYSEIDWLIKVIYNSIDRRFQARIKGKGKDWELETHSGRIDSSSGPSFMDAKYSYKRWCSWDKYSFDSFNFRVFFAPSTYPQPCTIVVSFSYDFKKTFRYKNKDTITLLELSSK